MITSNDVRPPARAGDNLAADPLRTGRSWEDFLSTQLPARSAAGRS